MEQDPQFIQEIVAKASAGDAACQAASRCLSAMRIVIVNNGCAGSPVAYFAAAVTTLQAHLQAGTKVADVDTTTSSLLLILRKSLGSVPPKAVHGHLNSVVNSVTAVLKQHDKEELVKQALGCIAALVEIAFDAESRPNRKVTKPVVALLADPRPAVRQRAQLTVTSMARRAAEASDDQTLVFIGQHLAQTISAARADKKMLDNIPARHAVSALKGVAEHLPEAQLTEVCDAVLKLPGQLGQHPVCVEGFDFLASFLEKAKLGSGCCQRTLAASLLPQLLSLPSTVLNVAYASAHLRALAALVVASLMPAAAMQVPNLAGSRQAAMTRLLSLFSERDPGLLQTLREELKRVVSCAGDCADDEAVRFLQAIPELCRPLLTYERKPVWPQSLPVISAVFDATGTARLKVPPAPLNSLVAWTAEQFGHARNLLKDLVTARDGARSAELNVFGKEIDQCFASANAAFGPEALLSVAPLQVLEVSLTDGNYEQRSRSWLLLVLKDSCQRTQLTFFNRCFMPLASHLRARAKESETTAPIFSKKYKTLLEQVWSLLPGFCTEPLDMHAGLLSEGGKFAKQMVGVLLNEPELRGHLWLAFKKVCDSAREPPSPLSEALATENMACMKQLSGHVLPEMFTTFVKMHSEGKDLDPSRVANEKHLALEAVKSFASISEPQLLTNVFKSVVTKLLKLTAGETGSDAMEAAPLADLANALVPLLPSDLVELVMKVFTPMLKGGGAVTAETVPVLQKAGYRAIQSVLQHPGAIPVGGASAEKVLNFWAILRDARETCEGSALKARLATLQTLLDLMQERLAVQLRAPAIREGFIECLKTILPEVMLHLRDQSTAVREAARDCLHVASTTALHQELESELVTLISAGLASLAPYSKAAAIDALSRLIYEHSYIMTPQLLDKLVRIVLVLLEDQDAQVYRAALKFCKVVVFVLPRENIGSFLQPMMKMFFNKHLTSSKMLVRRIMERFVKVLPNETLLLHVPPAHQPLLAYVQKQMQRRHRPKAVVQASGGDDDNGNGEEDAEMGDVGPTRPTESWADFRKQEDEDAEEAEVAASGKPRRRRRGEVLAPGEPQASPVMESQSVQALLDAWEAESDAEGERRSGKAKIKRKREQVEASTWIQEDQDVPLDFMSAQAAQSVLTVRPPQMKRQRADEVGTSQGRVEALRRHGLKFSEDGRLVMDEAVEGGNDDDGEGNNDKAFTVGTASKEKPLSKLAAMREARAKAKAKAKLTRRGTHMVKGLDASKPGKKKAQGDATRKGNKLEPFAYVKLNPKATKEKFKLKSEQAFAKVVQGAKKGIVKGNKARALELKLRKAKENKKKSRPKKSYKPGSR